VKEVVSEEKEEPFEWSEEPIDFSVLKEFDGHINVKLKQLKLHEYELNNVLFNAYLKGGKLSSKVKELNLYGGNTQIKSELDVNEAEPSVSLSVAIEGLDATLLPNKVAFLGSVAGKVNSGLDVVTSGYSVKEFVSRSSGDAKFNVDGGRFEGVDLLSMANNVAKAFNIYGGNLDSSTDFERVSGTFNIKDGIVTGKDFLIENQSVHFHGVGKMDLPRLRIDYKLTPKLAPEKEDIGIKLPIIIRGDLFKPVFRLEVESVVRDVLKNPEQKGQKIIKQIQRELKSIEGDDASEEKKPLDALKNIINKNILSIF
jgi:AsmA protein